ncbi:NAD-dependent epimerase/dehydratase family protein [Aureispira anguillae]|uniref:NAD-dependent epimerase/dehydratase family protein n=1 Tax=Aureispira anguillae TaxID=2864201 RepID=A0A916DQN6_9BACT|nr:NAD-dependent epimerase/dehydratase family protein [Aureispira anguillae]BDS11274.1 NAD-dependent epimerase/dehydratase family protein [Aureispira anguillae]
MSKILILGGANFVGRNLLNELQKSKKHQITLFNRGRTNSELFPEFERIVGDRNSQDVQQLAQQDWDYIIDISCYYPASLAAILKTISFKQLKRYIFVSTCSVYNHKQYPSDQPTLEDDPILSCTKEQETSELPAAYGEKKVACEQLLAAAGIDYISLRPGLIYGAYDYTDRFYYWLYQVQKKDCLLLPNNGASLFSVTYIDDLVQAILEALSHPKPSKLYNVISQTQISIQKIVDTACSLLDKAPKRVNAPATFLQEQKISEWIEMPIWVDGNYFTFSNQKLVTDFSFKLSDWTASVAATIAYYQALDWPVPTYGISEEQRLDLLDLLTTA